MAFFTGGKASSVEGDVGRDGMGTGLEKDKKVALQDTGGNHTDIMVCGCSSRHEADKSVSF